MKLQLKINGSISSLMGTPTKAKIIGKINVISFYNGVCNDSYYYANGRYNGVVIKGSGLESFESNGDVIVTGNITDIELINDKGEVVKSYYIPDCMIQLIDTDEEPDYELFD
jgi:hypothetical protein